MFRLLITLVCLAVLGCGRTFNNEPIESPQDGFEHLGDIDMPATVGKLEQHITAWDRLGQRWTAGDGWGGWGYTQCNWGDPNTVCILPKDNDQFWMQGFGGADSRARRGMLDSNYSEDGLVRSSVGSSPSDENRLWVTTNRDFDSGSPDDHHGVINFPFYVHVACVAGYNAGRAFGDGAQVMVCDKYNIDYAEEDISRWAQLNTISPNPSIIEHHKDLMHRAAWGWIWNVLSGLPTIDNSLTRSPQSTIQDAQNAPARTFCDQQYEDSLDEHTSGVDIQQVFCIP